jgi:hydroxymethylglutaryl-CoA synthase
VIISQYFKKDWENKCERTLALAKQLGNTYTGSLYNGLVSLACDESVDLTGKQVMMFSYGSGCAASMFVLRFTADYKKVAAVTGQYKTRLAQRIKVSPEEYD